MFVYARGGMYERLSVCLSVILSVCLSNEMVAFITEHIQFYPHHCIILNAYHNNFESALDTDTRLQLHKIAPVFGIRKHRIRDKIYEVFIYCS